MQKWNVLRRNFAAIVCLMVTLCAAVVRPSQAQTVVYNWNAQKLYDDTHPATGTNPFNWNTDWVARPNNTQSLRVTVPSTKNADGYYEFINTNFTTLKSEQEYKAIIKFQVSTSTKFPRFFYIFARNSNGDAYDIWRKIVDDPGTTRTVEMPMDLKRITAGDYWYLRVGMKGPGSIIIDSFQIVSGAGYTSSPASASGSQINDATGIPIATGATPVTIAAPATTGPVINATNLVADGVAGADATANFNALRNYLTQCKNNNASKLTIPTGVYRINASTDLSMIGMHDFVIDGQGSEFIFEGWRNLGNHFLIGDSNKIVIKNLKIDWNSDKKPIASLAQVQSYSETTESNGAISKIIGLTFPDLTAAQTLKLTTDASIKWLYMHPFDSVNLIANDPNKNGIPNDYPNATDAKYPTVTFSNIVGNSFTVKLTPQTAYPFKLSLQVGKYYAIRHMYYDMVGFKIYSTNNLLFDGVTIYSLPGMGWLVNIKTHHLKLLNCKIVRRTGNRNPFTSAADGFHVNESQGNLELNTCTFTGSGDDSVNIHTNCWQGTFDFGGSDSDTLRFLNLSVFKLRIEVGDVLEFYNPDYSPFAPPIQLTVQSISFVGNDALITFTEPWPNIPNWSIVRNLSYNNSNVRIAGCNFTYTSGRGILIGADNASITNCYFRNVFSTPIQFQTEIVDNAWAEGHGATNVVIKSNTFENCNQHRRWDGAIIYAGAVLPWGFTSYPLYNTMLVDTNRFFNCPGPAMSFNSSKNVVARNNTIEFSQNITNSTRYSSAIFTSNSSDMALGGNKWLYSANVTYGNPAVISDGANTSNVRPNSLPLNTNLLVPYAP